MSITMNKSGVMGFLKNKEAQAKAATVKAAAAGAKVLHDSAKANVPVDEGTLKSAIYRTLSKDNSTEEKTQYHVSVNHKKAPHFHLIELGTSRMPARSFIGRAKVEKGDEAVRVMRETYKKEMGSD